MKNITSKVMIICLSSSVAFICAYSSGVSYAEELYVEKRKTSSSPSPGSRRAIKLHKKNVGLDAPVGSIPSLEISSIERNQLVDVEIKSGALRIRIIARALRSGRVGDTISLINTASRSVFYGKVEGAGHVSLIGVEE